MAIKTNEKLMRFADQVMVEANASANSIKEATKKERDELLERGDEALLSEAYKLIQSEVSKIQSKASQELSMFTVELRRTLLLEQENVVKEVQKGVREKMVAFTKSEEYLDYMASLIKKAKSYYGNNISIHVKPSDVTRFADLADDETKAHLGLTDCNFDFIADETIKIGGAIFRSPLSQNKFTINETFDEKLNLSRAEIIKELGPVS